jgi:hypothetical protein
MLYHIYNTRNHVWQVQNHYKQKKHLVCFYAKIKIKIDGVEFQNKSKWGVHLLQPKWLNHQVITFEPSLISCFDQINIISLVLFLKFETLI